MTPHTKVWGLLVNLDLKVTLALTLGDLLAIYSGGGEVNAGAMLRSIGWKGRIGGNPTQGASREVFPGISSTQQQG